MLAYPTRTGADLTSAGGPAAARVLDGEIQEVTPEGALVWRWNSSDHIDPAETTSFGLDNTIVDDGGQPAYDLVHLNSVQQTGGVVVISARHANAVYAIDRGAPGDPIVWKLGGTATPEQLEIVGDPLGAASFGAQHDALILQDGTLTVHDNGTLRARPPRAARYELDLGARTAQLLESVADARTGTSFCCGSSRRLPGGNWLMSWGGIGSITELTAAGEPVLTLDLGAAISYRAQPVPSNLVDRSALRNGMDAQHPR